MRTDAARNRARILEAARELVAAAGPEAAMDAIAERAGVAVGTLYRHFPTKADLVAAVVEDSVEQMARRSEQAADAVTAGADPASVLADLFRAVADRHATDRAVKSALAVLGRPSEPTGPEDVDFPEGSPAQRALRAIETVLHAARTAGSVRPDVTVADLALLLGGVPEAPDAARHRYVDLVLAGIAVPDA